MLEKLLEVPKNLIRRATATRLQEKYRTYIKDGKIVELATLMRTSGVRPMDEIVEGGYRTYSKADWVNYAVALMRTTGLQPSEEITQQKYLDLARSGSVGSVDTLRTATGIEPKLTEITILSMPLR